MDADYEQQINRWKSATTNNHSRETIGLLVDFLIAYM